MTLLSIKEKNLILKQKQNGILEEKVSILTSSPNTQNVPYNTRNPIKSTSNTGANLSGIYYYYYFLSSVFEEQKLLSLWSIIYEFFLLWSGLFIYCLRTLCLTCHHRDVFLCFLSCILIVLGLTF